MKFNFILILILIFSSVNVFAYDKIYQFDMNDDIILSTTVYNASKDVCLNCNCTLTIFNPAPLESFINSTYYLINQGNGIYTSPKLNLTYNKNIYPITLICTQPNDQKGADDRNGIKISATMFDYTSGILAFLGVAIILMLMSFWTDKRFRTIKLVTFFSSFVFMLLSIVLGYAIIMLSPQPTGLKIIYTTAITIFLAIILIIIYLYSADKFEDLSNAMFGTKETTE